MSDSMEGDTYVFNLGLMTTAAIALIPGLVTHLFILGVHVKDWLKKRPLASVDHIVSSLGFSRICAQLAITSYLFVDAFLSSSLHSDVTLLIITMAYIFFSYANLWLTSLLSIVFCLKISTLRTRLFLYLRRVILPRVGHCIAASGLFSALNCLIHLLTTQTTVTNGETNNTTMTCFYQISGYSFYMGALIPLLVFFTSSALPFMSLYHHTVKMERSSNLSINLETYYSAMKFVSFTFMFNTTYLLGHFASIYYYFFNCVNLQWLYIILDSLQVFHSLYLIYRTTKLRVHMSNVLQTVMEFIINRKVTET